MFPVTIADSALNSLVLSHSAAAALTLNAIQVNCSQDSGSSTLRAAFFKYFTSARRRISIEGRIYR
jgi:hypothetical protein